MGLKGVGPEGDIARELGLADSANCCGQKEEADEVGMCISLVPSLQSHFGLFALPLTSMTKDHSDFLGVLCTVLLCSRFQLLLQPARFQS